MKQQHPLSVLRVDVRTNASRRRPRQTRNPSCLMFHQVFNKTPLFVTDYPKDIKVGRRAHTVLISCHSRAQRPNACAAC